MALQALAEDDYYDLHNLLTRNAQWNFVIGARGLGKTFAAKRYGIKEYLKHGHEFVYLRRTDVEQHRKETFFKDIQEFFPSYEFRVNGEKGQVHKTSWEEKDWRTCCYFVALSQAGGLKSVAYPKVHLIIFDEIFPDNLRFLSNEVNSFSEFYNTVDRWQDRTKVLFLSNAVQKANPYLQNTDLTLAHSKPTSNNTSSIVVVSYASNWQTMADSVRKSHNPSSDGFLSSTTKIMRIMLSVINSATNRTRY